MLVRSSRYASQPLLQPLRWQSRSSWIHNDDFGVGTRAREGPAASQLNISARRHLPLQREVSCSYPACLFFLARLILLQPSGQGQSRQPGLVVSRLDCSSSQHSLCLRVSLRNTLNVDTNTEEENYLANLREQRSSALPSPIVQGLPRQLVAQVILHLDINGSHHIRHQRMSPCHGGGNK